MRATVDYDKLTCKVIELLDSPDRFDYDIDQTIALAMQIAVEDVNRRYKVEEKITIKAGFV